MHNKLSQDTLLKLKSNPHFKMTEEQKEQLAELNLIKTVDEVKHNTRVKKSTPKLNKHSVKLKEETHGSDYELNGLEPIE